MVGSLRTGYNDGDLSALGGHEALLTGEIALSRLARLRELLCVCSGSVKASMVFGQ